MQDVTVEQALFAQQAPLYGGLFFSLKTAYMGHILAVHNLGIDGLGGGKMGLC